MSVLAISHVTFALCRENAQMPTRATDHSGGFDIYSPVSVDLLPRSRTSVPSGVAHAVPVMSGPFQLQGLIMSRSGLAAKQGVRVFFDGIIDADYRGEIMVCLENTTDNTITIHQGDRIAQIMYTPGYCGKALQETLAKLPTTSRGQGGHGSTGR